MTPPNSHGGHRPGAGKPRKYGEPTRVLRVPESLVTPIRQWLTQAEHQAHQDRSPELAEVYQPAQEPAPCRLPLYASRVAAGFPSPAEDYVEGQLDLNEHLIQHPAATFYVRVAGDSMRGAGIYPNDILVVDRAIEATPGRIVIAVVNGELTVKRLTKRQGRAYLQPENRDYPPIELTEAMDCVIWGVVTGVVRRL
ncbi:MAG: translesion error-prone DNA polymerase V autoproteolytic subunit [Candidatus Competibacteraceae bacterium]